MSAYIRNVLSAAATILILVGLTVALLGLFSSKTYAIGEYTEQQIQSED